MKAPATFAAALTVSLFSACTSIPADILGGTPGEALVQIGGKLDLTAPNGVVLNIDNQKSWEDTNRTVNTLGTGWIIADAQKAIEAGKRGVETATVKAGTDQAKIASGEKIAIAREETARMKIEAAEPPPLPAPPPAP